MTTITLILRAAAVTSLLTLAFLEVQPPRAQAAPFDFFPQTTLERNGCTFTLLTDRTTYLPAQSPTLKLVATNPTDQVVTTDLTLAVAASSPPSPLARMLPVPADRWSEICALTLAPGERVERTFEPAVPLLPEETFFFQIRQPAQ